MYSYFNTPYPTISIEHFEDGTHRIEISAFAKDVPVDEDTKKAVLLPVEAVKKTCYPDALYFMLEDVFDWFMDGIKALYNPTSEIISKVYACQCSLMKSVDYDFIKAEFHKIDENGEYSYSYDYDKKIWRFRCIVTEK